MSYLKYSRNYSEREEEKETIDVRFDDGKVVMQCSMPSPSDYQRVPEW